MMHTIPAVHAERTAPAERRGAPSAASRTSRRRPSQGADAARPARQAGPAKAVTFAELGVPQALTAVLSAEGLATPFPIQADTLPDTLGGRDVLGRGKTGSGKTLAFLLPLAARLGAGPGTHRTRPGHPRGLILAPTRELAGQIDAVLAPLAAACGLRSATIFGGVSQRRQVDALHSGVDVIVACPGRLEDLIAQGFAALDAVEITVLDEADHMADLGFLPAVTRLLTQTPPRGQRMLFSATLDNGIDRLVARFLHDPRRHSVDEATSPVAAMTHHVFEVAGTEEKTALVHALASGVGRRILFTRTKHHAKKLAKKLTAAGIPAVDLHGNLSQNRREHNLASFADGTSHVLVATDIAARGVDIDDVELVVHVDPPAEHKAYLHRSGRTARAGHAGDVVTLCLPEQRKDLADLLRKARVHVEMQRVGVTSEAVVALIGEVAPYVAPVAAAPAQARRAAPAASRPGTRGGRTQRGGRSAPQKAPAARGERETGGGRRGGRAGRDGAAPAGAAHSTAPGRTRRAGNGRRAADGRTPVWTTSTGAAGTSRGRGTRRARG